MSRKSGLFKSRNHITMVDTPLKREENDFKQEINLAKGRG
jgi:hypothetical protein